MPNKKIDFSLLDPNMQTLINASAKIFPVPWADILLNLNPNGYEYAKPSDDAIHRREIYNWSTDHWELIGADDIDIEWIDIKNKPTSFTPFSHTHIKADVTDFTHTHAETDIIGLTTDLGNKADAVHTHAEGDITNLTIDLASKASTVHTHAQSDITNLTTDLANKASAIHNHDGRYYTQSQTDTKLSNKSDITHNHDTTYAVKSIETTVSDHEERLDTAETNISTNASNIATLGDNMANGDMHSNIAVLNKLVYTGSLNSIDLKSIENNATAIAGKANTSHTHTKSQITDFPTLATVATSGEYTDLTNKPAIPDISGKADKSYVDLQDALKTDTTAFTGHTGNTTVHVTQTDKDTWNAKEPAIAKNTAFNVNFETTATNIKMNGTRAIGSLGTVARADHIHPVDTSRAPSSHTHTQSQITDLATIPTAVSQLTNDSSTQITITNTKPTYGLWIHD